MPPITRLSLFYLSLICLTTRWCSFELLATTTSFVGALLLLAYFISISMFLNECIKIRGWRNTWGWKQDKNYNASYCQPRYQVLQLCYSHPEAAWQKDIKILRRKSLTQDPRPIFFYHITYVPTQRLKGKSEGRELLIYRFFPAFLRIKFISLILACV